MSEAMPGPPWLGCAKGGDNYLLCGQCGRRMGYEELTGYEKDSIIRAIADRESQHARGLGGLAQPPPPRPTIYGGTDPRA